MDIAHFVYPFISWWSFRLFPLLSYYEQCCCEHLCTSFYMDIGLYFHFSGFISKGGFAGCYGNLCLTFLGAAKLFSQAAKSFYFPTSKVGGI